MLNLQNSKLTKPEEPLGLGIPEIELCSKTDSVLEAALALWVQANKGPIRGMRATQISKAETKAFISKIKALSDSLGDRFDVLYPKAAKALDEAILKI